MRFPLFGLPVLLLAGCSGGNKDTDTSSNVPSTPNQAPLANAGADQSVPSDATVNLSGAASTDPDGDALTYLWAFDHVPTGSAIESRAAPFTVNHAGDPGTTFSPDVPGTYIVALTVRDSHGATSAADYVIVNADAPSNLPVANAGADTTGRVGTAVTLDGSRSYDSSGRALTYAWNLVDKPVDSTLSGLSNATSVTPTFTPDVKGTYIASLVVNNGLASSPADAVSITVTSDDHAPVANAGVDQTTEDCTTVHLDCSASTDPDGDRLQYYWSVQLKPTTSTVTDATFSDRTAASPTFYPDQAGTYVLSCAVFDGTSWSVPDTTHIDAAERATNASPTVNAGRDQEVNAGSATCTQDGYSYDCDNCADQTIALGSDASVTDADGDPLTVAWTVTDGEADIASPGSVSTQVVLKKAAPETPGECTSTEYRFELSATDCTGANTTDRVSYTVTCCGVADTSSVR